MTDIPDEAQLRPEKCSSAVAVSIVKGKASAAEAAPRHQHGNWLSHFNRRWANGWGQVSDRVVFVGNIDPEYPRNAVLRRGLKTAGANVETMILPTAVAPSHIRGVQAPRRLPGRLAFEVDELMRTIGRHAKMLSIVLGKPRSAIVVAEFNQGLVALAWLATRVTGSFLIVDFLVSLYDTAVLDRRALSPTSPRAIVRRTVDRIALRCADLVLFDTDADARDLQALLGVRAKRAVVLPVGAPEWQFPLLPIKTRRIEDRLSVLYYGNYIPLHGVDTILGAARLLREDARFVFTMLGKGQTYERALEQARHLTNITFVDPVPQSELMGFINDSDVCLGVFGVSDKASRTVPNKVWQCLASGRALITGEGDGPRQFLHSGRDCVLIRPGDPQALANALLDVANHPSRAASIATTARATYERLGTSSVIGRQFFLILKLRGYYSSRTPIAATDRVNRWQAADASMRSMVVVAGQEELTRCAVRGLH